MTERSDWEGRISRRQLIEVGGVSLALAVSAGLFGLSLYELYGSEASSLGPGMAINLNPKRVTPPSDGLEQYRFFRGDFDDLFMRLRKPTGFDRKVLAPLSLRDSVLEAAEARLSDISADFIVNNPDYPVEDEGGKLLRVGRAVVMRARLPFRSDERKIVSHSYIHYNGLGGEVLGGGVCLNHVEGSRLRCFGFHRGVILMGPPGSIAKGSFVADTYREYKLKSCSSSGDCVCDFDPSADYSQSKLQRVFMSLESGKVDEDFYQEGPNPFWLKSA